jgi:DNA-binding NarL/FixJ family response regulator
MTTPATTPISVLIADDDEIARSGLTTLLTGFPDIAVAGVARDGAEAIDMVAHHRPDIVLMDIRMPHVDGIEATTRIRAEHDQPAKVIAITTFQSDEYVYEALRAGAQGFILKRSPITAIAHAIRVVFTGESLLFPDAIRTLITARGTPVTRTDHRLTNREFEILRLIATGMSNQDIADKLYVSRETVKTHVGSVLLKLGASNRTQAVIAAYETGIVVAGARA